MNSSPSYKSTKPLAGAGSSSEREASSRNTHEDQNHTRFVLNCVQEDTSMGNTTTVSVRVPAALKNRLDKLAEATARSRSWLAARALQVYVENQEWQIAAIREGKKDVQAGRVISHEKTARWLRTWGKKRELPPPSCA